MRTHKHIVSRLKIGLYFLGYFFCSSLFFRDCAVGNNRFPVSAASSNAPSFSIMILRIRLPSGVTERVTLGPEDSLSQLGEKINALNKLQGQFALYSDPRFTRPFVFSNANHGDVVFIKGTAVPEPTPKPAQASSSTDKLEEDPVPETKKSTANGRPGPGPRCRHGPRGMCEHCMPKEDKRARAEAELRRHGNKGSSIAVIEALEALKFRISPQQEPHASAAAINSDAAHAFQAYLAETGFTQQRIGICYGTVDDENTTNVHTVYEPPQRGDADAYAMVEGEEAGDMTERADRLADMLGLRRVGIVISARPRKCILSAMDVVYAAQMIAALPEGQRKSFIIFVVTTAETGETLFEAYQISDLAVEIYQAEVFEDASKQKPNGGRVLCKQDVIVEGKDTRKVPTEFFILNVPIKSCDSWLRTAFTVENRDITPQNPNQLSSVVNEESVPYHKRLADFHLLLFLSNVFDMKSDMPGLCSSVKQGDEIGEGYRLMIENMASS